MIGSEVDKAGWLTQGILPDAYWDGAVRIGGWWTRSRRRSLGRPGLGVCALIWEAFMALIDYIVALVRRDEEGQGLAEYALILALIAIVAIVALLFLGGQVSTILSKVGSSV